MTTPGAVIAEDENDRVALAAERVLEEAQRLQPDDNDVMQWRQKSELKVGDR